MKKAIVLLLLSLFAIQTATSENKIIELRAERYSYTPNIIKIAKGDVVTVRLISVDVTHGFFLDGYEVNLFAAPGKPQEITFRATKAGKFSFRCSRTCGEFHPYMSGYLRITPNIPLFSGLSVIALLCAIFLLVVLLRKKNRDGRLFGIIPLDWRYELTRFKAVRALFKSRWFPLSIILVNLFVFTVILVSGITGGFSTGNYNFGIMFVWILWYVVLMLFLVPVGGRLWCMMCPFPMFGDWLQRGKLVTVGQMKARGLRKRWPKELRNLWPLTILFFVSTFFSAFFTVRPLATFILLSVIIVFATIVSVLYERRTFCLYFCPVSGFQGLYSNFAATEVRVKDPEICRNHSRKTCFLGNENGYGCPWNEQPFVMSRNTNCGMCLECFKTCPYDNMAYNLRPPGVGLIEEQKQMTAARKKQRLDEAFKGFTMLGIMIVFFLTMQGPYGAIKDLVRAISIKGYLGFIFGHVLVSFILLPGFFLLFSLLSKKMSGNKGVTLRTVFREFGTLLVPIGIGAWAAFSVGIILPNGSYLLHVISDPFAWGWDLFGTADYPWTPYLTGLMPYIQIFFVSLGLLFSLEYGFKIARKMYGERKESIRGWIPMLIFLLVIHTGILWLFIG